MQNWDYYWWKKSDSEMCTAIFAYVRNLDTQQANRQIDNMRNMRLYSNMEVSGFRRYALANAEPSSASLPRLTLNVVQSQIDTVTSKIAKNKPRPYFLTEGGDWSQKRRAERLTQFTDGQFYETRMYEKARTVFKDSCIFGTGALKYYVEDGKIKTERVFIDEIMIDDNEALYGEPRQLHQKKWVHKDVLKAAFPRFKGAIDAAVSDSPSFTDSSFGRDGNMLLVIESWKLPSGPKSKDGMHAICINNQTLFSEDYTKSYFPFTFMRWNTRPLGFFGQGISEQLTGLQLEINKLLKTIQVSMHLVSIPKIFMEASSKIVTTHLNNKIGGIIKYAGQPPTEGALGRVPIELFQQLERLYDKSYQITGISQMSAQSQKPAGLNSGKALRTYNDIESERFMDVSLRYEQFFLDASKIMIDMAKDLDEYKVTVPGKGFISKISWKDVQLDEDMYVMQVYPTNSLSQYPSQRLAEVQELIQAGFVSKEYGTKLLDFPDLKGFYNMANAGIDNLEKQIERIVDKMEYMSPEPYQNLQFGISMFQNAYLHYQAEGAPEEMLELFRRWISAAEDLLTKAAQPQVAPEETQTLAAPQAAPVSDLIPLATATQAPV